MAVGDWEEPPKRVDCLQRYLRERNTGDKGAIGGLEFPAHALAQFRWRRYAHNR